VREEEDDIWNREPSSFRFFCTFCATPERVIENCRDNRFKEYFEKAKDRDRKLTVIDGSTQWKHPDSLLARHFEYNGTEESLKCKNQKYSKGPDTRRESCDGKYGAPTHFYLASDVRLHEWRPWLPLDYADHARFGPRTQ
jgi:hypothetical protein